MFGRNKRAIFKYHDGERKRRIDPMEVWQSLHDHPDFNLETHPGAAEHDDAAFNLTVDAVRQAFDIQPYSFNGKERGLAKMEVWDIYVSFIEWASALKKNIVGSPTSQQSTDSPAI